VKIPAAEGITIERDLPFPVEEFQARLARVRQALSRQRLDALLVTTPENIYYLSGYQTPGYYCYQCLIVPAGQDPIHITRCQEETNVKARSWIERSTSYLDQEDPVELTAATFGELGLARARIGIEKTSWFLTIAQFEQLRTLLGDAAFANGAGIVEECRVVKSEREIAYIRRAAQIAEAGMKAGLDAIREGVSEDDVAAEVQRVLTVRGSEYPGLPIFVTAGIRSSFTHATWSGGRIQRGDPVLLEISGCVKRYSGALMRTAVVGPPSQQIQRMADASITALETLLQAVRPGRALGEVWEMWAQVVADAGFFNQRRPGYSIGVNFPPDWGEGHIACFKRGDKRALVPNMTFHTPSLIQLFGLAQIGNSETLRVTPDGCELLTRIERRLFVR
jgi:Xaa-Pro dipeptidase